MSVLEKKICKNSIGEKLSKSKDTVKEITNRKAVDRDNFTFNNFWDLKIWGLFKIRLFKKFVKYIPKYKKLQKLVIFFFSLVLVVTS